MKLVDALEGYWLSKRLNFSPRTIADYTMTFDRFVLFFSRDVEIEAITSTDIHKYLQYLPQKYPKVGKRTLSNHWIALSSLWTWAEQELQIPHIIRGKVQRPQFVDASPDAFTHDELKAIVQASRVTKSWRTRTGRRIQSQRATRLRDEAIVLTLVDTGLRASELCALAIRDYDQNRGRLHVCQGKGDKVRYVVVGTRTSRILWRYLVDRGKVKPNDPLFATQTNHFMRRDNLYRLISLLGANAGVSNCHPHRFRHTFAIQFLRNGGSVLLLKELLGHESIEMVMRYARLAEQDIDKAGSHSPVDGWNLA